MSGCVEHVLVTTRADVQTARQAKVNRGFAGAYLDRQLAELETKVRQVNLDAGRVGPAEEEEDDNTEFPRLGSKPRTVKSRPETTKAVQSRREIPAAKADDEGDEEIESNVMEAPEQEQERKQDGKDGNPAPMPRVYSRDALDDQSAEETSGDREWKVVVLDTSALLWAPQGVRRLIRQGWEVIVPSEALRTLDLLKSGSSPSARAARSATRFIEHSSRHHKPLSSDPSIAVQSVTSYKRGRGLRLQNDNETRPPHSISSLPIPVIEGDVLPKWMENVLSCAAYFIRIAEAEQGGDEPESVGTGETGAILYVANPPLTVEIKEGDTGNIGQRGEGYLVSQEAERFEIPIEVLRDEDDEVEHEIKGKRAGGKPRPKQEGGRGRKKPTRGGRKADESQEREVKILLRRPVDETRPQADQASQAFGGVPSGASPVLIPPLPTPSTPRLSRPGPAPPAPVDPHHGSDAALRGGRGGGDNRSRASRGYAGGGAGGGRGRGNGRGRGGGFHGGEFVMLQRPGPTANSTNPGTGDGSAGPNAAPSRRSGPPVVLLQRPK